MKQPTHPPYRSALFALIRQQPLRYAWAQALWISIWTMPVIIGLVTAQFFDGLVDDIATSAVVGIVAATFAYAAGRSVVIFLGMRNHGSMLFRGSARIRRNLLDRIYEMPGADPLDETPGEIVSRFRDDVEHLLEPFDLSVDLTGSAVSGTVSVAILWFIDPVITVAILIPVLAVGVVANRTGGLVRRYRTEARETTEAITGFLGETFGATQSIKVAGAEDDILGRFTELNEVRRTKMVRDRTLTAVLEAVFRNTVNIGTGLVLLLAAGRLVAGSEAGITVGEFTLIVFLLGLITEAAYFWGIFVARTKQGAVSFARLIDTLDGAPWQRLFAPNDLELDEMPADRGTSHKAPAPFEVFELKDVSYHYPGTSFGIDDIDLRVEAGEFVVVTGRIGSGKTTLLRSALGLLPIEKGELWWNDERVDDPPAFMVPPRVAYTPQVPRLFSMSLLENLVLGDDIDDEELDESIHIATMTRDIETMPEGLETMIGPRGVRLSGGQVQRSASARMLSRRPQLLVLDDVSSALDVETEQLLWNRLFSARAGVAALVVSHRQVAMNRADRVVVMEDGRIAAVGTAARLKKTSDTFRAIWEGTSTSSSRG
ncbi:MAG: ABC transporter ATP-binding protein [Acidimicrobiia bacterium]|nr:ABC transporter ATP-binding protein [Acidimicrobiia bacterium]